MTETKNFYTAEPDLDGKSILVTGGTGSFGQRFIKTVLQRYKPARLIVFSRDEMKQYHMQQDPELAGRECMRYFLGDVRNQNRLRMALREVDVVIHAAALKHVPAAEYNPFECINTNVLGAENVVQAALDAGVNRTIALSTDKAVNPINLYGASKLASDKIFVAANNLSGNQDSRFSVVRYGNVLGSRGSVVPFFRSLISNGADHLPITDFRMTRFWITLAQGVEFVLSCLTMMTKGEIFVPKIPSMKIVDLAKAMAPDLPHKEVGIRPGEKLHEIMVTEDDARNTLELDDRYVICPIFPFWSDEPYTLAGAQSVSDRFSYSSDGNDSWLNPDDLRSLLAEIGLDQAPPR